MSDTAFYTKLKFTQLMREKRGVEYTYGWLEMAYAMPSVSEAEELELIQRETQALEALPDYTGIFR